MSELIKLEDYSNGWKRISTTHSFDEPQRWWHRIFRIKREIYTVTISYFVKTADIKDIKIGI